MTLRFWIAFALAAMSTQVAAAADPAVAPAPARAAARGPFSGICVFSRDAMFASADISAASNRRLQQLRDEAQAEADQDRLALQADRKSLEEGQAGLSPVLLKQLQDRLVERALAVTNKIQLRTRELERTRQQATAQIDAAAIPIIRDIERANACTILFQRESVLDAPGMVDITTPVIAAMNLKLQSTSFQRLTLNGDGTAAR